MSRWTRGIDTEARAWFNRNMDKTHAIEANVEFGDIDPDTDYEELLRQAMIEAGWIDSGAWMELAGWDSILVVINDATRERLNQERYLEIIVDEVSISIESEEG